MSSVKKKIAIFITSLRAGGAERIVSYLINEGYDSYEFHLILLHDDIEYLLPSSENIKIVKLKGGATANYLNIIKIPWLAKRLKRYLVHNDIQVVLSLLNRPNLICCYVKRSGWRGRLIISERADTISYYRSLKFGFVMLWLVKLLYNYSDIVISISIGISRSLEQLGIRKSVVIYNPIYVSSYVGAVKAKNNLFTFINIARLEPQKNHTLLLQAFAKLDCDNCRLLIVGKGSLLKELTELAVSLKIAHKVNFTGFQSDTVSLLNNSDCFVLTSNFEGFGNVILEALNCGLPIISTDCPYGPREILAPSTDTGTLIKNQIELAKYGVLTPVANVTHLVGAMRKIIDDSNLRNAYRDRAKVRASEFNIKNISHQYFELF